MDTIVVIILLCATSAAFAASTPCSNCDGNNVTCVDGVCLPRCVNVTSSGQCLQCRDSRLYGEQCEHDCPDTCLNSRCQMNNTRVVCTEGCVAGKKGDDCGVNCPTACTQCERYGDGCTGPCKNPRYYGPQCRTPCSSSCTDGCNRITGECGSCEPGYTGDKCDVTCPPNCRDGCDKDTGECDSCEPGFTGKYCDSCVPGYMGTYCNVTCPPNCNKCHRDTGECDKCAEGFCRGGCDEHGDNCNSTSCKMTCRANCKVDDFTHNQCTGPCINENYYGKICTTPCPDNCDTCEKDSAKCFRCGPGLRGDLCNESCPSNCIACDRSDGTCMGACRDDNYHGANCSTQCPVSCDGCDKETGRCMTCGKGFSRTYCDEMCSPCTGDACQRLPCKTRSSDHSVVISIGSVAGVLCCAVLILIFKRHITQPQCTDRSSRNCSDTVGHRYWEIDVNLVAEQSEQTEQSAPAVPLTERPRERLADRNPSGCQLTDESPSQTHWPKQAGDIFAGSEPQLVDSTPGCGVEKESLLTLLCASGLAEADSDSRRQSVHSEGDIGINISGEIQRMTERTDSIIFLEENCDLSSVSVRYLTTNNTH
ncbi:multiple epidermal growth factor-like domains protein 10 [Haliotis cracherodii]|uniref:multiple epidermal growth factor-like domains protein 10 n=1 Tax=Haliotis cracherodii TaxID=6455 RepID=UPI0039E9D5B3